MADGNGVAREGLPPSRALNGTHQPGPRVHSKSGLVHCQERQETREVTGAKCKEKWKAMRLGRWPGGRQTLSLASYFSGTTNDFLSINFLICKTLFTLEGVARTKRSGK